LQAVFSCVEDFRDYQRLRIGAVLVTKKKCEKFKIHERLNPLHPAPDVSQAELRAEWGDPKDFKDISEKELEKIRQRISRKRELPVFTSMTLPPKVVRDAWYGAEREK
jgi:hypothetical protein